MMGNETRTSEDQGRTLEELKRELKELREQRTAAQKAEDRARVRATRRTPGSQQWVGETAKETRKFDKKIADLEAEIATREDR